MGEVDHVGGIAKAAIRREVANGSFFYDVSNMVEFLTSKFDGKFTTSYSIKELDSKELDVSRSKEKLMSFRNVKGSSNFQVVVFTPNEQMRASMRLCVCIKCRDIHGVMWLISAI